jgi:hypothetical protein
MDDSSREARFNRYYRRMELGLRLLAHGARPRTASDWSGLSLDRLVTLKRRWMPDAGAGFRGPPPSSFQLFFRSHQRIQHAAIFACLHHAIAPQTADGTAASGKVLSIDDGERLCEAFEICNEWEPGNTLELDQAVLIAHGVSKNEELGLVRCSTCRCAMLVDKLAVMHDRCDRCRKKASKRDARRNLPNANSVGP